MRRWGAFAKLAETLSHHSSRTGSTTTRFGQNPSKMTLRTISSARREIDLFKGWPSETLLPPLMLKEAAIHTLSQTDPKTVIEILEYGDDEGYRPLRQAIGAWLTEFYHPPATIEYERICITGGASQNLANCLSVFTDPIYTHHVWMVAPTYYLACRILADGGFDGRFRAVPEDEQGIDLRILEEGLKNSQQRESSVSVLKEPKPWRKLYRHLIYCVPTFANPSGRVMSLQRRQGLVRLARKYDALVVSDDVYDMLQWPTDANKDPKSLTHAYLPRLVDIDRELDGGPTDKFGNCLSNGSFSKIVGPGVRTGWAEGTPALAYGLAQTGASRSGGAPSHLTATFISDMLKTGALQKHISQRLLPEYAERYHNLTSATESHLLPLGVTIPQPNKDVAGGYFVWLRLPGRVQAAAVVAKALEQNLIVIDGPRFRVDGSDSSSEPAFAQNIRLCFAWADKELLAEGVVRLADSIRACQQELNHADS